MAAFRHQSSGKFALRPGRTGIDLLSVSSHKIHGPKGIGFLYVSEKVRLKPIVFGGGQQNNLRSGTENVPGIAGMAMAAKRLYEDYDVDVNRLADCKAYFIDGIREIEGTQVNGLLPEQPNGEGTAPHIVSVSFRGVRSEVLLHALEEKGIFVSAGSACSSHKPQPSATLKAMGLPQDLLGSTIRFSFSVFTTREELEYTLTVLKEILPVLRLYTRKR